MIDRGKYRKLRSRGSRYCGALGVIADKQDIMMEKSTRRKEKEQKGSDW